MNSIKQPNFIIFGKNSVDEFNFPTNCLVITSKGAKSRGWLDRFKSKNYYIFDKVESSIPKLGIIELEDKENKFKKWINTSSKEFQELTNNIYVNQPQEFKKQLNKIGITYLKIDSKENYVKNLIKLFKYRKKQK